MTATFEFGSVPTYAERLPWIPIKDGEWFKPLRFLSGNRGRTLLLRLEPGVIEPLHRHTGEVHGFNLEGSRQLLESGQIVGPGDYVYEPAGNQDSWMAVGDVPCVVFISLRGALEYLGPDGDVIARDDTESMAAGYRTYCEANGLEWFDLSA